MKIEELEENIDCFEESGNNYFSLFTSDAKKLLAVAKAAKILVGKNNIGKTVDTTIQWDGDISAIMNGKALGDIIKVLAELEKE